MSREVRIGLAVVAVVVGLNLLVVAIDALIPSPEGPRSSAFATSPEGAGAWAELLRRSDREVRTLRERVAEGTLPAEGTVVVLDPDGFTPGQARALREFAEGGGRVVAGGLEPGPWIAALAPGVEWSDEGEERARVLAPTAQTGAARSVRTAGEGRWTAAGDALPLVGSVVLTTGNVTLVADPSPLQNRLLDEADNAALALALAGSGPVTFVESVHGYGTASGLAALPARFRWALVLLGLSALVLIAARWPRLGPAEPPEVPRFPPRRGYVDALAATLARSRDRKAAVESVREAARDRLGRRAALDRDASDDAWYEAARAAGLSDEEAAALVRGDDEGIAAGSALARLSGEGRRA